ncbi:arylamine N-acetyltransferase [Aliifodinibius sp. S!AR15-10]|uniref:arylamine N-acetyltransferase family protein n=1 Tax=Aliifodinibius sp. S!AR15-10 TaxID=2950437 RepID=UPI0028597B52|nr:arylamine N-acetyltransferase [Aliifodinibius sp. S!AR15-10]MDR8393762.1 arylamine N-acetyltransferase [Aliifodinibius sp. S!AR15-10]
MSSAIDLDAYFARIGYEGAREANERTLRTLHEHHTQAIPFENLNPLLGLPVKLDLDSLEQKMVHQNRGGYCFEQNLLFKHVLEAIGFSVKGLAARIRWNLPDGRITPRGHMLLLINLDGKNYLADTGFGGLTLTDPLLLEPDKIQETTHESYRLIKEDGLYIEQALVRGEWKSTYSFDLQEQFLPDYEVSSWYLSNKPDSHFVTGLIAARPDVEKNLRYALHNNKLSVHHLDGETEKRRLDTPAEIREVLETYFQLTLPGGNELDEKLQQVINSEKETTS